MKACLLASAHGFPDRLGAEVESTAHIRANTGKFCSLDVGLIAQRCLKRHNFARDLQNMNLFGHKGSNIS